MEVCNMGDEFPKGGISIDRKTPLGNPFIVKQHGCRLAVVAKYRIYLYKKLLARDPEIEAYFRKLTADSKIVCHCAPELCHGDVIKAFYEIVSKGKTYEDGLVLLKGVKIPFIGVDPREDGYSHINTYSQGETRLGRMLSNFYRSPVGIKGYGYFQSLEGFWYYLSTGCKNEKLREVWGAEAKKLGREMTRVEMETEEFQDIFKRALCSKIMGNSDILNAFIDSSAPFVHYYWYGKDISNPHVVLCPQVDWMMDYLNDLRRRMKACPFQRTELILASMHGKIFEEIEIESDDIPF